MNIDNLIEQLIKLKSQGAEIVNLVDSHWNDLEIEDLTLSNKTIALITLKEMEMVY